MRLLTISNLYPRPDRPQRGMFNFQLFAALHSQLAARGGGITNICLVPRWQWWCLHEINGWENPHGADYPTRYLPAFYLPVVGRSLMWHSYLNALERELVDATQFDAVLSAWLYPDGVSGTSYAELHSLPSCMVVQGSDSFHLDNPRRRRIILQACESAKAVVCVCQSLRDKLVRSEVNPDKLRVVPNGVDGTAFSYMSREDARRKLASPLLLPESEDVAALFVGNLVHVKGPDLMLRAWQRYRDGSEGSEDVTRTREERRASLGETWEPGMGDDIGQAETSVQEVMHDGATGRGHDLKTGARKARLIFIGDGPMRSVLERAAHEMGIDNSVSFVGSVSHEKMSLWMNAADCLCLSSRSEGMPNVVLEAMACGLPVVATDTGACKEMLSHYPGGKIVPVEALELFADALHSTLVHRADRRSMARESKDLRSWSDQASEILEILE